jgi:hypothetical protein
MRHEEAWRRLPDLLDDRDDGALLTHVRACAACQRQLFLLGRVDRLLRDNAVVERSPRRRPTRVHALAVMVALMAAALATLALLLILPPPTRDHQFMLRTASGRVVGEATMSNGDSQNVSLALTARHLPIERGQMFVLWAGDQGSTMQVGRFMVDRSGGCRVRFNLPESHGWRRFWVTQPGAAAAIVAST